MSDTKRVLLGLLLWVGTLSALHFRLNLNWSVLMNDRLPEDKRKLYMAYIPVT